MSPNSPSLTFWLAGFTSDSTFVIFAAICNLLAMWLGGIEVEVRDVGVTSQR